MLIWSLVLFGLGVLAVLDSQFNYGYVFRSATSMVFMLLSLGVLLRTRMLEKLGFKEQLIETNKELKAQVEELKRSHSPTENRRPKEEVAV
jgi:hypothetical protein